MGNYKFKISDMMPNSWFYKLKNMSSKPTKKKHSKSPSTPQTQPKTIALDQTYHPRLSHSRKSYHITRENLPNSPIDKTHSPQPPTKSSRRKSTRKSPRRQPISGKLVVPSPVSSGGFTCSCHENHSFSKPGFSSSSSDSSPETVHGETHLPEFRSDSILPTESSDGVLSASWSSSSCSCGGLNSNPNDIEIDLKSFNSRKFEKDMEHGSFDVITGLELPPIVTNKQPKLRNSRKTETPKKPNKTNSRYGRSRHENHGTEMSSPGRRFSGHSPGGMRLRVNSPRIASRRLQHGGARRSISSNTSSVASELSTAPPRKSVSSDSFAVVKTSVDPGRDFMESMVEMILQNNIWDSKDLEELLACYLSLNADEYHDLIITVFKQIWVDLTVARRIKT